MGVVRQLKESLGMVEPPATYECQSCGTTFESNADENSRWLRCLDCDSDDVVKRSD